MNALYRTMSVRMSLLDFFTQYMYNQEPAELSVETASAARVMRLLLGFLSFERTRGPCRVG